MLGEFVYSDLRFAEWMAELTGKRESDPDRPGVVLLRAEMPRQFIINLRDTHRIPAEIEVVLGENQENCIILGIQVQNMPALRVEDLLQPGRLALLPFYIYTHAGDLQVLAEDPRQAELLIAEIADICTQLRQMSEEGTITPFEHSVLLELMRVVTRNAVPGTIVSEKAAEKVKAEMLTIALDPVGLFRWKDRDRFAAGKSAGRRHKRWDGPRRWIRSARTADPHR
ncbi:MAG: hypothetical protein HDQ87_04575 [Clostridia bacterium]|nr:hypothetical protein [Clostridia bacterium]